MTPRSAPPSPLNADLIALLASCRSAPADDTPRLVLADWLEEHADVSGLPSADDAHARAALIRVQVELARPTFDVGHVAQLRSTEQRLLATHAERWLGDLPRRLHELRQRTFGLVMNMNGVGRESVFAFDPLARWQPWRFVRGLLIVDLNEGEVGDLELGAWFASPLAVWVEEAAVTVGSVAPLERFAVPTALRPYLGVRYTVGAHPIPTMRFGPAQTEETSEKSLKRLLKSKNFALVRDLTVYGPALEVGFPRLMAGANVSGVRRLALNGRLNDTNAAFLAQAALTNLSALDVSGTGLTAAGLRLIANAPHLRQVVSLIAYRNQFGDDGLVSLSAAPLANTLNTLEVQNTGIADYGVMALANSPLMRRLHGPGLNLSMNPISDEGAKALAACEHLERFTELILRDCHVFDRGAKALADSPHVANLTYLDLGMNRFTDLGAQAFVESPYLEDMRALNLRDNHISETCETRLRARFADRVKV